MLPMLITRLTLTVLCLVTVRSTVAHLGHHDGSHGQPIDGDHQRPFTEHDFHHTSKDDASHQKEHISQMFGHEGRKHLEKQVKEQTGVAANLSGLSGTELMVHFFKLHDFDKNEKLDGLELIAALSAYYSNGLVEPGGSEAQNMSPSPLLLQEEVEGIVDRTLDENDIDGDGFITFVELVAKRDSIWNSLDDVDDLSDSYDEDYEDEELDQTPTVVGQS